MFSKKTQIVPIRNQIPCSTTSLPTAIPLGSDTDLSQAAICRRCGQSFYRDVGVSPMCDAYFRCSTCRGLHVRDFCLIS